MGYLLTCLLTHSLTHLLNHSLTHSPAYLLTQSLTHSLTHSLTQEESDDDENFVISQILNLSCAPCKDNRITCMDSLKWWCAECDWCICTDCNQSEGTHSLAYLLTHSLTYSLTHPLTCLHLVSHITTVYGTREYEKGGSTEKYPDKIINLKATNSTRGK